jgi:large subunit ribosomal protein L25
MQIGDTITLDSLTPPPGVKLIDDPETVIATLSPPRLQLDEEPEIEEETELVAEGEGPAGEPADGGGDEAGDGE